MRSKIDALLRHPKCTSTTAMPSAQFHGLAHLGICCTWKDSSSAIFVSLMTTKQLTFYNTRLSSAIRHQWCWDIGIWWSSIMPKRIPWGKLHPLLCQLCLYLPALAMGRFVDWTGRDRRGNHLWKCKKTYVVVLHHGIGSRMVGSGAAQKLKCHHYSWSQMLCL